MSTRDLAQLATDYLSASGSPIFGVVLHVDAPFPWVELWDDDSQVNRLIVFCDPDDEGRAEAFAGQVIERWEAEDSIPCGALAMICTTERWHTIASEG